MINFELCDYEFERFTLSGDAMFAVPVTFHEDTSGNITCTVYSSCEDDIKAVVADADEDVFDSRTLKRITDILTPMMARHGFNASEETGEILLEFSLSEVPEKSSFDTVIIKTEAELSRYSAETTTWNLTLDDDDPYDVICAAIDNGSIAAYACANDLDGDACEVNVECAPAYRRRGLASACAADFARYILTFTDAERVSYVCRERNVASIRTAHRAGFKPCGRSASFVFYR